MKKIIRSLFVLAVCLVSPIFSQEEPQVRVYVDIVGDLFHSGHVEFLKKAKSFGNYLIVGVLADEVVEGYKRTPILSLEERVNIISACKYIDEVIAAPPVCLSEEMIHDMNISYVVHGDDLKEELVQEHYGPSVRLGIFRTVPYTQGVSTTEIIQRICKRHEQGDF